MIRYVLLRTYDDKLGVNVIWLHEKYAIEWMFKRSPDEVRQSRPMYIQHKSVIKYRR